MPRINFELIQQILLALEDSYPDWRGIDVGIEDDRLRSYLVDFLRKDGLVEAKNWGTDQTGDNWKPTRLTPDGHRLAEAIRAAPPEWREKAKESVATEGSSLTWDGAKRYFSQVPNDESKEWHAFVCYASEDREAVARPLATLLSDLGLRVWYDEMELRVGDRLRRKIDAGLARCRFGVVILSESFFGKHYPESELDGLAQREQDHGDVLHIVHLHTVLSATLGVVGKDPVNVVGTIEVVRLPLTVHYPSHLRKVDWPPAAGIGVDLFRKMIAEGRNRPALRVLVVAWASDQVNQNKDLR